MSAFDTFLNARDSTIRNGERAADRMDEVRRQNALRTAGQAYAGGDNTAGRNALLGSGMLNEAVAMDASGARQAQVARETQEADRERHASAVVAGAQGLRRMPAEQRWQVYQARVLPYLRQAGVGDDVLSQITEDNMGDADLDSVILMSGGEAAQPRYLQGQRGAIDAIDPYTGAIVSVRQAAREEAPNGYRWTPSGALEAIPGGPADPRQAGTLAGAKRAPKSAGRGRSSGGSSSAASRSFTPSSIQWD